ncbi:hypothetical protein C8K36_11274 [Rhodococcus sp. OK519]|uniref:YncE family protein n=1 Tax=Rhodococcus sp. OK519 TaxID=2135729 RepID=UPI000D3D3FB8|nr:hypothetical protein C8K36_11274 [Rhodococcus sp. OK519]
MTCTVSVIGTTKNFVTTSIPVGSGLIEAAITPDGRHAYVTNCAGSTVSVAAARFTFVWCAGPSPLGLPREPDVQLSLR